MVDDVFRVRASIHDVERNTVRILDRDPDGRQPDTVTEVSVEASYAQAEAMRTGGLVAVVDEDELRTRLPRLAENKIGSGVVAGVAAPLVLGSEPRWARCRWRSTGPPAGPQGARPDLHRVTTGGCAYAAAPVRAGAASGRSLQASLMPEQFAGGRLAVHRFTLAGEAGLSVGGDWDDVTQLPHGPILLSVGDVTGGTVTAGVMGLVRAAVRALALSDPTRRRSWSTPTTCYAGRPSAAGRRVGRAPRPGVRRAAVRLGRARAAARLGPNGRRFSTTPRVLLGTGCLEPGTRRATRSKRMRRSWPTPTGCASVAASARGALKADGRRPRRRDRPRHGAKVVRRLVGRPTADET